MERHVFLWRMRQRSHKNNWNANGITGSRQGRAATGIEEKAVMLPQACLNTPSTTLPNSALYLTHTEPGPGHLIETDPRFTQYKNWLSSDYMLQQLNNDPARTLKRLGDGYYEQKLVADQIMLATGYRFTGDYTNKSGWSGRT
ncbi:MAG TPA: hypothetical protein VF427_15630 [Noviherbaspirillum sp.]